MTILCLDQFGELGGAQRCLLDLLPALIARGRHVHVAASAGPLTERAAALGAAADTIRCGPYSSGKKTLADIARFAFETPRLAREIRTLVVRHQADIIYVNGPRLLPAVALAAPKGSRVLFHSHSLLGGYVRRLAGWALTRLRADIVASSRFVAGPLLPYSNERGIRVVYNGVRRIALPVRERPANEFRIGVIGRISPEKGQVDFLHAARILHGVARQCRFLICGGPLFSNPEAMRYCTELEALAEGLPVEFAGWKENIDDVLASLDLVVVPSAAVDATPRVILEAFSAGVPVMAFAAGGIPELIEPGVTGFLVAERTPKALALAMLDVLESPQRRRDAAARARTKALGEFSLERYRRQMVDAIEAVMGSSKALGESTKGTNP